MRLQALFQTARARAAAGLIAGALSGLLLAKDPGAAQSRTRLAAQDSHEGLTVIAEPWTDPSLYKQKFSKKNPYAAGIAAVHVTFQNDSAESLRINLERIRLLVTLSEDTRQDLTPLSPEDVANRTLGGSSDPTAKRTRIPLPVGRPKPGRTKDWAELEAAAREAGVTSSVVPPHGKVEGLLYFDIASQFDLLPMAHLYIPEVLALEKNKTLFYFDLDLSHRPPR